MKIRKYFGLSAVALILGLGGREAWADQVFHLSSVTFASPIGGTATGTFTTNDAMTALLDYDITTTSAVIGGTFIPGFNYNPSNAPKVTNSLPDSFSIADDSRAHSLLLVFTGGLTAAGATLAASSSEDVDGFTRVVASGSVGIDVGVNVPEPSSLLLSGIAATVACGLRARTLRASRSLVSRSGLEPVVD